MRVPQRRSNGSCADSGVWDWLLLASTLVWFTYAFSSLLWLPPRDDEHEPPMSVARQHISEDVRAREQLAAMEAAALREVVEVVEARAARLRLSALERADAPAPRCRVLYMIVNAKRESAEKAGLNYLLETVRGLLESEWPQWDKDNCVLVTDNTADGQESLHLQDVVRHYPRVRVSRPVQWPDPYPQAHEEWEEENMQSTWQRRRQASQLAWDLLAAYEEDAEHVVVMEDDMRPCGPDVPRRVLAAIDLADADSAGEWSLLRVGFGGNGMVLHSADVPLVTSYLLRMFDRRPVDWLIPEWAARETFVAAFHHRRRIYTYRWNLFLHIGGLSTFDGRVWKEEQNAKLPGCYKLNTFLRPEEMFDVKDCADDISPCKGAGAPAGASYAALPTRLRRAHRRKP
jgi:hypothetical protein